MNVIILSAAILCGFSSVDVDDSLSFGAGDDSQWFWFVGMVNNHPRLGDAEKMIDKQINQTFRLVAPGYNDVMTFKDEADAMLVWTPFFGLGRKLSLRWDVFLQTGYTAGSVRTKTTDTSLLLVPLKTDVQFKRSSFYAGIGTDFFPWGRVESRSYYSLADRLQNIKPFFAAGLNWNYLTANTKVQAGLWPFENLMETQRNDRWNSFSVSVLLGIDIPLNPRNSLTLNGAYNHFFKYTKDFSGPSFSVYLKHSF